MFTAASHLATQLEEPRTNGKKQKQKQMVAHPYSGVLLTIKKTTLLTS